jgi:ketosteroid isomerase-like protein
MNILLALAVAPLLLTTVAACGSASHGGRRSSEATPGYHDEDDTAIVGFGHPADAADKQAISSLVRRYYAAAFAGDGRTACGLMDSQTERLVPAIDGSNGTVNRGQTCPTIMSKLFGENHNSLTGTFETTDVYVKEDQAYALVGFSPHEIRYIRVHRQNGAWMIDDTLGQPLT